MNPAHCLTAISLIMATTISVLATGADEVEVIVNRDNLTTPSPATVTHLATSLIRTLPPTIGTLRVNGHNYSIRPIYTSDRLAKGLRTFSFASHSSSLMAVGKKCKKDSDCEHISPNTQCTYEEVCTCQDNYKFNASSAQCVTFKEYGAFCQSDAECMFTDLNFKCGVHGSCVCRRNHYYSFLERRCIYDIHCNWNDLLERCSHTRSPSSLLENLFFVFLGFLIVMGCCNKPRQNGPSNFANISGRNGDPFDDLAALEAATSSRRSSRQSAAQRLRVLLGMTPRSAPRDPIARRLRTRADRASAAAMALGLPLSSPSSSSSSGNSEADGTAGIRRAERESLANGLGSDYILLFSDDIASRPPPPPFSAEMEKPPSYEDAIKMSREPHSNPEPLPAHLVSPSSGAENRFMEGTSGPSTSTSASLPTRAGNSTDAAVSVNSSGVDQSAAAGGTETQDPLTHIASTSQSSTGRSADQDENSHLTPQVSQNATIPSESSSSQTTSADHAITITSPSSSSHTHSCNDQARSSPV